MVKQVSTANAQALARPFKIIILACAKIIGVPVYRGVFWIRRAVDRMLMPAKHRLFYLLSNRFMIHVFMVLLVSIIVYANIQGQGVRAETFGQKSTLYAMVAVDTSQEVEVIEAGKTILVPGGSSRYLSDTVVDQRTQLAQQDVTEVIQSSIESTKPATPTKRNTTETYTVQAGDTLGKIAVRYNLSISTILSANGLTLRSTIRPGDTLKILPEDGIQYTVTSGDTLSRIASRYDVKVSEIISSNELSENAPLKIGQKLILPGATELAAAPITRTQVGIKDIIAPTSTVKPTASGAWVWPTNWHIITQYYGWKHTGIDIDGDYTTFSLAAHDGVVSFTGWRNGYGLTVEIDHGNGLKTRYAHNSKIYVRVGDVVAAGQRLAQTGTTGNSTGTHLHFEVILNGKFQNPLSYVR